MIPNKDFTYCTSKDCKYKKSCKRNMNLYNFNKDELYWFMERCEKYVSNGIN